MDEAGARARGFEEKYDAYGAMTYRLAMVYLGCHADAEDVVQEAFLRLLYRAPEFTDAEHEKRWLIRVTVNLCRDQLRGFWKKRAVALEEDYPMAEPEVFGMADAVVRLPEKYKAPIHLHYYEGYTAKEIGRLLGKGENTIYTRLARARELLGKTLGGDGDGA